MPIWYHDLNIGSIFGSGGSRSLNLKQITGIPGCSWMNLKQDGDYSLLAGYRDSWAKHNNYTKYWGKYLTLRAYHTLYGSASPWGRPSGASTREYQPSLSLQEAQISSWGIEKGQLILIVGVISTHNAAKSLLENRETQEVGCAESLPVSLRKLFIR